MKTNFLKIDHMKKMGNYKKIMIGLFLSLGFTACSDDEDIPEHIHEEELITTMEIVLSPQDFGEVVTLSYRDLDGDGPGEPIIENGVLMANATYFGEIILLNETVEPAEDISLEIEEEGADHQFFFHNDFGAETSYKDQDENANPIGLLFELKTNTPGTGSFQVILRHEPDKTAPGVKEGNIENAGGTTDISVNFEVEVQ